MIQQSELTEEDQSIIQQEFNGTIFITKLLVLRGLILHSPMGHPSRDTAQPSSSGKGEGRIPLTIVCRQSELTEEDQSIIQQEFNGTIFITKLLVLRGLFAHWTPFARYGTAIKQREG
jgi:hypothetical protein